MRGTLMKKYFLATTIAISPFILNNAVASDNAMIVTASRTSQMVDDTLASVSVVTRDDIKKYQYQTVAEAINGLPGVVIANSGGRGQQTSIFLRGTESNHTQIFVNGAKLATNSFGAPQIEHIPLNQIERIELVRGPQSSLYGSGSIGGTIQIFTKKGAGALMPELSAGFGSNHTKELTLGVSGGDKKSWYNFSGGYTESDGFNACDERSGTLIIGCFAIEPDDDGYQNTNSSIRFGHQLLTNLSLEVFSLYSEGDLEYDGFYNQTDFSQHTYGANFNLGISDVWSLKSTLSQGKMNVDNQGAFAESTVNNTNTYFTLQNDIQLNQQQLVSVGYDYENDEINALSGYSETQRDNHAVFAQLLGSYGSQSYQLALRRDDNEQFGGHTTGNIAWGNELNDSLRVNASFGTAFVAPSFTDLYSPFGSNPLLDSEQSKSYEVGVSGQHKDINWSANLYRTEIENLIALDNFFIPQNISEALIHGLELQAGTELAGIDVDAQFSWVDPENRSGGINDGKVLARRAEQLFTLNMTKVFDQVSVAAKLFASGRRFDNAANTRRIGGFTTLDLVSTYKVNHEVSMSLKIANISDKEYETVSGYNADGRNIFFSISYQPQ